MRLRAFVKITFRVGFLLALTALLGLSRAALDSSDGSGGGGVTAATSGFTQASNGRVTAPTPEAVFIWGAPVSCRRAIRPWY